jgi:hypothetical protein
VGQINTQYIAIQLFDAEISDALELMKQHPSVDLPAKLVSYMPFSVNRLKKNAHRRYYWLQLETALQFAEPSVNIT